MTKTEFLTRLGQALKGLPENDAEERVAFYAEMIDDRAEDGLSEGEAVGELGDVEAIAAQIIADTPLTKLVRETVMPKKNASAGEKLLLILGAPLWIPLLLASFAVAAAFCAAAGAAVIALWAADLVLCVGGLGGVFAGVLFAVRGYAVTGAVVSGAGMACIGLSVFLFFGCRAVSRGFIRFCSKAPLALKRRLMRKERKE